MAQFNLSDPPSPAPDVPYLRADGSTGDMSAFAGRLVLVNFWATWCAPCVREMPSLDRLQAAFDDRDFVVAAVSVDRGGADVTDPFLEKLQVRRLTVLFDPKMALARAFGVRGMPTTFLVDRQGRVVGSLQGMAEWDDAEAQALIRHYLDRPAASVP